MFKFKAKDTSERDKWVDALKILHPYASRRYEQWEAEIKAFDHNFVVDNRLDDSEDHADLNPIGRAVGNTVGVAAGIIKKGVRKLGSLRRSDQHKMNHEYLQAKNFSDGLDLIEPSILRSRIKMGFILRNGAELAKFRAIGNMIDNSNLKEELVPLWCLLISSRPIQFDNVDPKDEVTLQTGNLPLNLEFDTLYMFNETCDGSSPVDTVPLKDVAQVTLKRKAESRGLTMFILDLGERKISLFCTSLFDVETWLIGIQASRAITTECQFSILPSIRNLYWAFKDKDGEKGAERLKERVLGSYEKIMKTSSVITSADSKLLVNIQGRVVLEFLEVINACLVHRHRRVDVIKVYEEIYHEHIIGALRAYFKTHAKNLINGDIFDLIKFLDKYRTNLEVFGSAFNDTRILEGIHVLCNEVSIKVLRVNMKTVNNIIKYDIEQEPELDGRGELMNKSAQDIFKLLNEVMCILPLCNVQELGSALLKTCQDLVTYFQNGLETLIMNTDLSNEQLIAICNGAMVLIHELKDFTKQAQDIISSSDHEIKSCFDNHLLSVEFATIARSSRQKLTENILFTWLQGYITKGFLQVDLNRIAGNAMTDIQDFAGKLNQSHMSKIPAEILKEIVSFCAQSFFSSINRKLIKPESLREVISKLNESQTVLKEAFGELKHAEIDKELGPIRIIEEFLIGDHSLLTLMIGSLVETHKDLIEWSTIETLLHIRKSSIPADQFKLIVDSCKEVSTALINSENLAQSPPQYTKYRPGRRADIGALSSLFMDNSYHDEIKASSLSGHQGNRIMMDGFLSLEGGLLKDVVGILSGKGDGNYFTIRKDDLYCYKNQTAKTPVMKVHLKEASDCYPLDEKDKAKFVLKAKRKNGNVKDYRFVAENKTERDQWVKAINDIMKLHLGPETIRLSVLEEQIVKDNTPMFFEYEKMPSLKYEIIREASILKNRKDPKSAEFQNSLSKLRTFHLEVEGVTFVDDDDDEIEEDSKPKFGFLELLCLKFGCLKTKGD